MNDLRASPQSVRNNNLLTNRRPPAGPKMHLCSTSTLKGQLNIPNAPQPYRVEAPKQSAQCILSPCAFNFLPAMDTSWFIITEIGNWYVLFWCQVKMFYFLPAGAKTQADFILEAYTAFITAQVDWAHENINVLFSALTARYMNMYLNHEV